MNASLRPAPRPAIRVAVVIESRLHELARRKGRYGLATLCVSGGMGMAMAIERV